MTRATEDSSCGPEARVPEVGLASLKRLFSVPSGSDSTLNRLDRQISSDLRGFLSEHIVAGEKPADLLEQDFLEASVPENPVFVSEQLNYLMNKVVAQSVHTAAPTFIGHMATPLPYFMLPLAKIMIALNQNLVKIETSKAFTPLERQVLAMLHHTVFRQSGGFYARFTQSAEHALGAFCSDGTIANITALWVALNRALPPGGDFRGVGKSGLLAACRYHGVENLAVLVSEYGHYSLAKAAHLLGIGSDQIVPLKTRGFRVDSGAAAETIERLRAQGTRIVAVVGVAGTTETGHVDPLKDLGDLCSEHSIHFHVDAAWGGPTLLSDQHRRLLAGIESADSVTIDAHKQLYVPMGAGMVLFRDPEALNSVQHHARYIIRKGSRDLGGKTLEGSRPGMAMLVHSGLRIFGRRGYALLMETGIQKAREMADLIMRQGDFELTSDPQLNILTYRFIPRPMRALLADPSGALEVNNLINRLTAQIQKRQRAAGRTFVSRTTLRLERYQCHEVVVFRVVLANPLTEQRHILQVLEEQRQLAQVILEQDSSYALSRH